MKSVAFNIKFQSMIETLSDNIINEQIKNLKEGLKNIYPNIKFRE